MAATSVVGTRHRFTAQAKPAAGTLTDLVTAPTGATYGLKRIVACNQAASADTFRVSLAPAGAADATSQYQSYDTPIQANDTYVIDFEGEYGELMAEGDVLRVSSGSGNVSFRASGREV